MQSRLASVIESIASTAIGYAVALIANLSVLPLFGYQPTLHEASWIAGIFTAISLVRGYFVRRLFNFLGVRRAIIRDSKNQNSSREATP